MSLLVIDIGSSACKAAAFTRSGTVLARHASAYTPHFPQPGRAEIDPQHLFDAVCSCTQAVTKNVSDPVQAITLSSHGETFIPTNEKNEPIGPAILNQDNRAVAEASWLEQQVGRKHLFEKTGLVAHPMYPLPKIIWLRNHQKQLFSSTAKFVSIIGYILVRLGLQPYVDYSLASRYLAFNVREHSWAEDILAAADLGSHRLPALAPAGTVVGGLDASSAKQLGVSRGTPVVLGGHDQACGALGSGVIAPGHAADSIGTYECLLVASDEPILTEDAFAASLNSYCHVVPNKFVTIAYFPSGIMMKWFHDLLYANISPGSSCEAGQSEPEQYARLETEAPAGPTGLCITPDLIGTCNPDFNPHARAVIYGLNIGTGRGEIYKGILEGLACEFFLAAQLLGNAAGSFQSVCVYGGGMRSELGLKLRAALAGKPLRLMRSPEAVCLGGAILAAVALREYANFEEAVGQLVHEAATVHPDPEISSAYAQQLKQYQLLRSSLAPMQALAKHS